MCLFHMVVFIAGWIFLTFLFYGEKQRIRRYAWRFALFIFLLLVNGSITNGLWGCLIYNRFYHSADYIFDFSPFWPVSGDTAQIDQYGTTLFELDILWSLFAGFTWLVTFLLFFLVRKCLKRGLDSETNAQMKGSALNGP